MFEKVQFQHLVFTPPDLWCRAAAHQAQHEFQPLKQLCKLFFYTGDF
jgi:hypothetical protein